MEAIKSFADLTKHLQSNKTRKRIAVANAVDSHTVEAVLRAVEEGIVEAYLLGDVAEIETTTLYSKPEILEHVHIIDVPDAQEATLEAVRMVKEGEADILMKGLVNTDVILRAILDKEKGLLPPGNVLTYNAALEIPRYHKLLFFTDPAVIPYPTVKQRTAMIKYAVDTCHKFGIKQPKVSLIHATEKYGSKLMFMDDYLEIKQAWRDGEFGDILLDGPLDIFLALDEEKGAIKNIPTPILGDSDVVIFPEFASANVFYKTLSVFADTEMGGLLYGTEKPCVLTSRSDSSLTKFYSIALACILV